MYTEPYKSSDNIVNEFDRIDIVEDTLDREIQEQKDAELARKLQQQEDCSEESQMVRDRLLAMEAQDKELAKLLQERERQKVKRAREKAKQKALAKKQMEQQQLQEAGHLQIMPDDSYSNPIDLLPTPQGTTRNHIPPQFAQRVENYQAQTEEDLNYSIPVDVLSSKNFHPHNLKQNYSPQKNYDARYVQDINEMPSGSKHTPEKISNCGIQPVLRPTQLDLKGPLNRPSKSRYPDQSDLPEAQQSVSSPSQHANIAMAIDPTYNRRSLHGTPNYDTTSSTITTSTCSSSPGALPPPDISELEDETSPVPPYMPIQGQRRTSSLEKKPKKKGKDGCKQQ